MAFKISLLSDVAGFLRGTKSVEDSLDDVADSLDDLARDTAQDAEKAADALERKFSDALHQVKTDAKDAGKSVGDDITDGSRKAGEGMDDMKQEAGQTAREVAASFGSVEDALDGVQELAANALAGFGPAGMAAGVAAAIGIGILKSALEGAAEQANATLESVHDVADAVHEAEGNPELVDWAEQLRDTLKEISDTKEWWELWQAAPVDKLTSWSKVVRDNGLAFGDVVKAATGDTAALARVLTDVDGAITQDNIVQMTTFKQELLDKNQAIRDGIQWEAEAAQITADLTTKQREAAAAAEEQKEAERQAAEASAQWSAALTDHLSVADEGLDRFVKNGKLNLKAWADELAARAKDTEVIEDFSVTIAPKLSPEALAAFAELPAQTQAQIAKAYTDGDKKDRKKIVANLEAEAKVTAVTLDTTQAQTAADQSTIEVPTTIVSDQLPAEVRQAADTAQRVANQRSNEIEFATRIDSSDLQRQVDRAAASIRPPTIYANVKPKKEVP